MFQVDGISYNVLVPFGGLKRSFEIKEGTGSLTYIDGDYDRDVVGTYYNYEVQIDKKGSDQEDYDALYEVLSAPEKSHSVTFPYGQSTLTFDAYITGGEDTFERKIAGKQYWGGLNVTFYAKKPKREPT